MFNQFFITRQSEIRFFSTLALMLCLLVVVSYVIGVRVERGNLSTPTKVAGRTLEEFPAVALTARAAYVYDARTKTVLFAENEDVRMPLASLTKVMSALVAQDLSPEFGTVTVTSEAVKTAGDSGFKVNERWALKDLLDFSLISSSNDGMHAVALSLGALDNANASSEEILNDFVQKMNAKASELGLKNTYFWNETGLDESEVKGGAYGTARDITALMEYIIAYEPEMLEATQSSATVLASLDNFEHKATNTNDIIANIPGLIASKTGYTNTAGGNLTFVFDPELGRPIIVTILGSTEQGRFEDAQKLIKATLDYING